MMQSTLQCEIKVLEIMETKHACCLEDVVCTRTLYRYQEYVLTMVKAV